MIKQNGQEQYKCKFCEYSSAYKIGMQKHQKHTLQRDLTNATTVNVQIFKSAIKNPYWNSASQRTYKKCEA